MNWITGNWHLMLDAPVANALLTLVALVSGSLVGLERERKGKSAGLRTMALVCAGSAVFTIISIVLAGPGTDHSRVAAQIVTGVGFLGAGTIMRGPIGISGITTAATVWIVAAIGMTAGAGYGIPALVLAISVVAMLIGAAQLERKFIGACTFRSADLRYSAKDGKARVKIDDILDEYLVKPSSCVFSVVDDGLSNVRIAYCTAHRQHREFLPKLAALPEVQEIRNV